MKKIRVVITFSGAAGGMAHIIIQGAASSYSYDVDGSKGTDRRDFHLNPGIYTIRINGITGGSVSESVTGDIDSPISNSLTGPNIFDQTTFLVK